MGFDQYLEETIYIPYDFGNDENPRQTIKVVYANREGTKLGEPTEHVITDAVSINKRVYYWRNMYEIDRFLRDATNCDDGHNLSFDGDVLVQLRDYLQEYLDTGKTTEDDEKYEEYIRETYRKTIEFINSINEVENKSYAYWAW